MKSILLVAASLQPQEEIKVTPKTHYVDLSYMGLSDVTPLDIENRNVYDVRQLHGYALSYERIKKEGMYFNVNFEKNYGYKGYDEDYLLIQCSEKNKKTFNRNWEGRLGFNADLFKMLNLCPYIGMSFTEYSIGVNENALRVTFLNRMLGLKTFTDVNDHFKLSFTFELGERVKTQIRFQDPKTGVCINNTFNKGHTAYLVKYTGYFKRKTTDFWFLKYEAGVRNYHTKDNVIGVFSKFGLGLTF